MNLAINAVPASLDSLHLPDEKVWNEEIQAKSIFDFTKVPFYKRKAFIQNICILATLALACVTVYLFLGPGARLINVNNVMRQCPHLASLMLIVVFLEIYYGFSFAINYRGYDDPQSRENYRLALENDKISCVDFVSNHGWENIRRWGFFIPKDQQPLCTKDLLIKKILEDASSSKLRDYLRVLKFFKISVEFTHYELSQMSHPVLWDAFDHELFTQEQKIQILKKLELQWNSLKGAELLANWRYIKKWGLAKYPLFKNMYQWLENNQEKYEQIEKLYTQKATYLINKLYSASYISFYIDNETQTISQEVLNSLPISFNSSWLMSQEDYANCLVELNTWFLKQLNTFNDEFISITKNVNQQ